MKRFCLTFWSSAFNFPLTTWRAQTRRSGVSTFDNFFGWSIFARTKLINRKTIRCDTEQQSTGWLFVDDDVTPPERHQTLIGRRGTRMRNSTSSSQQGDQKFSWLPVLFGILFSFSSFVAVWAKKVSSYKATPRARDVTTVLRATRLDLTDDSFYGLWAVSLTLAAMQSESQRWFILTGSFTDVPFLCIPSGCVMDIAFGKIGY